MTDFHFIRPLWLIALAALVIAIILLKKYRLAQSGWQQLLPKHLSKVLIDNSQSAQKLSLTLPFIIGLLAIIALAGPSWQKLPQPVYQIARGSVLIMDMSYSMYATDIAPNRLTRARFKAIDLLDNLNEGEMGLIAYAGDAFIISPLTDDTNNIKLLLPSLSPDLMPELGSNPFAALTMANEMLTNAGHVEGDIYWFTDGIDNEDIQDITKWSREYPHRLNILGIGTALGAPIKLTSGELMKDSNGAIIIPKLSEEYLTGVASRGRGKYTRIKNNSSDIKMLTKKTLDLDNNKDEQSQQKSTNTGDQWQEAGPYLLLFVLPLVLVYFRRGRLLALLPICILFTPIERAHANIWQDLWKTSDQQAQDKYNKASYEEAAEQFNDPLWQGSAHYKAGNYQAALSAFQKDDSAQALYNQGNALAQLQQVDEAIKAYEDALAKNPELADAKANKELLEQMKKQQESQQDQQGDTDKQDQDENQDDKDNKDQQDGKKDGDQQKDDKQGEQQEDQSEQGEKNNDSSDKSSQEDQQAEQDAEQQPEQENDEELNSEEQQKKEEQEQKKAEEKAAQQAQESEDENDPQQSTQAQLAAEKLAQETEQKHQQLLNKVTDDPYLLLRNKMQLEYQKRRQNRGTIGVNKKW
ncbi:MAG: Ca-activated chloride channel family protein [Alteromonadaceae bacterium]|jgi:Ca-activated chloride channel family protein